MVNLRKHYLLALGLLLLIVALVNGQGVGPPIPGAWIFLLAVLLIVAYFVTHQKKPQTPARKITKIILLFLAVPIILVSIFAFLFFLDNQKQKSYIQAHYSPKLPPYLSLTGKTWTDGSIDVRANWLYSYASSKDLKTTFNDIVKSLQSSGYQIATGGCPGETLTAVNKSQDIYITVSFSPAEHLALSVEADKNNHDNVWIDPQALTCSLPHSDLSPMLKAQALRPRSN